MGLFGNKKEKIKIPTSIYEDQETIQLCEQGKWEEAIKKHETRCLCGEIDYAPYQIYQYYQNKFNCFKNTSAYFLLEKTWPVLGFKKVDTNILNLQGNEKEDLERLDRYFEFTEGRINPIINFAELVTFKITEEDLRAILQLYIDKEINVLDLLRLHGHNILFDESLYKNSFEDTKNAIVNRFNQNETTKEVFWDKVKEFKYNIGDVIPFQTYNIWFTNEFIKPNIYTQVLQSLKEENYISEINDDVYPKYKLINIKY